MSDIRTVDGLWCDDITFCPERCGWKSCPRNKENIRDRSIPHSFSVEIPQDCPKKEGRTVTDRAWSSALEAVVYCKDCMKRGFDDCPVNSWMPNKAEGDFFCADGEHK